MHHNIMSSWCGCRQCLLATSAALFDLRDALHELSLTLQDWQFETNHAQRLNIENKTRQLLEKIASEKAPPG